MNYFLLALKKYADFNGRSRRAEYWYFTLFNLLIVYGLTFIGMYLLKVMWLGNIASLALLLPAIAVGIRRMHDVGKSGWFILIPFYNLILAVTEGIKGPNEYGPDPKGALDTLTPNPEVY